MNNPILVYRGNYVESTHMIHIAVVDKDGKLVYSYGDPYRLTFPRSSMKPFQAIPLIETGAATFFSYQQKDLALSCSSHAGEGFHREAVQTILERIGLGEQALQCGTHTPWNLESYKKLLREGKDVTPLYSNCSGKHSGMLATAVYKKEDVHTYRQIEHPVQQRILNAIEDSCNYEKEKIQLSVDGCGVPVHQLPLYHVALGYARLARPNDETISNHAETLQLIRDSMMSHPEMVGGTNRLDTDLMTAYRGRIVSKAGAEAVQCFGLVEEGLGVALKVEDGGARAVSAATMEVIKQLGLWDEAIYTKLQKYVTPPVLNARKEQIGKVIASFSLEKIVVNRN